MSGKLYIVATPIGNLEDITLRALRILKEVDLIAAEDTRHTLGLLNHFEISKPLISYYKQNEKTKSEMLIEKLLEGKNIAIVSDAGTPGISDPGEEIVKVAIENGIEIIPIPGACAFVNALIASGLSSREFAFIGFLSAIKKDKKEKLEEIKYETKTLILYEAPHHLLKTVRELLEVLGDRELTICRELTKKHEEKIQTTFSALLSYYEEKEPRGEYVLVIDGATNEDLSKDSFFANMTLTEHLDYYISLGMSKMDATKAVAKDRGVGKSTIYNELNK